MFLKGTPVPIWKKYEATFAHMFHLVRSLGEHLDPTLQIGARERFGPRVIHWGHAGAMATVLAMGGYGTFLGWSTRRNGSAVYPLSLGPRQRCATHGTGAVSLLPERAGRWS